MLRVPWPCQPKVLDAAVHVPDQELALDAVRTVAVPSVAGGPPEIDIKKYAKVEKLPGGSLEDCRVLSGVMFQKVGARGCRACMLCMEYWV